MQTIPLGAPTTSQFVKFDLVSWHGKGGGLQYFDIGENFSLNKSTISSPVTPLVGAVVVLLKFLVRIRSDSTTSFVFCSCVCVCVERGFEINGKQIT